MLPCQVYGVVLPHDSDPRLAAPRSRSEPTVTATPSAAALAAPAVEGHGPLPPLLSGLAGGQAAAGGAIGPAPAAAGLKRELTVPTIAEGMLPQVR